MTDELKPCPFCGSKRVFYDCGNDKRRSIICCLECGAGFVSSLSLFAIRREDMVRLWNRRVE